MKKDSIIITSIFIISILLSGCVSDGTEDMDYAIMAEEHLGMLMSEDFGSVYELFDQAMQDEISITELEELWADLMGTYGEIDKIEDSKDYEDGEYFSVEIDCLFTSGSKGTFKLVYDEDGQISGFWFTDKTEYSLPPYADPDIYTEIEMEVVSGDFTLPAVLALPDGEGPFPCVVLVHGSGPNDMDETIGPNKPFKDIATGLASKGVAVLRYDKRTYAYPVRTNMEVYTMTLMEETVFDALAAVDTIKNLPGIDPNGIFIAGHSLGGMSAPRIASLSDDLAGIIILAGNARPVQELVIEQFEYLSSYDGVIDEEERAAIDDIVEAARKITELDIGDSELLIGAPKKYWEDLSTYDQVQVAKGLDIAMLLLQGERDYQVTMADFDIWSQELDGMDNTTLVSYPGLNHLFMFGTSPSIGDEYLIKGIVEEQVILDIVEWMEGLP